MITNPFSLISDIWVRFLNPFQHPTTIGGVTLLFTVLLSIMYVSLLNFNTGLNPRNKTEDDFFKI